MRVFVCGGGPSLKGFDWSRLDGEFVVAANFSAPSPTVSVVNDARIIRHAETRERWMALPGDKVFVNRCCVDPAEAAGARVVPAVERWSGSVDEGLVCANNCGLPALNLADCIGADVLYLLGFDLTPVAGRTANWHDFYPREWSSGDGRAYVNMLRQWGRWAEYVRTRTVNLNPASALECFPKADPETVLGVPRPVVKAGPVAQAANDGLTAARVRHLSGVESCRSAD